MLGHGIFDKAPLLRLPHRASRGATRWPSLTGPRRRWLHRCRADPRWMGASQGATPVLPHTSFVSACLVLLDRRSLGVIKLLWRSTFPAWPVIQLVSECSGSPTRRLGNGSTSVVHSCRHLAGEDVGIRGWHVQTRHRKDEVGFICVLRTGPVNATRLGL